MTEPETVNLRIGKDLYARLRAHCDRENVRFLDFIESALEDTLAGEPAARALADEAEHLRKKAGNYDYAFNRGFGQGFAFLYLMLHGLGPTRAAEEELKDVRKFPAEAPRGRQMGMF
jgi:hypothetical protein